MRTMMKAARPLRKSASNGSGWRGDEAAPTRPNPRRPRAPPGKSRAVPGRGRESLLRPASRRLAQNLRVGKPAECLQAAALDLADPFACDVEHAADFVQRHRGLPQQAIPELEDATRARRQRAEDLQQRLL